MKVLRGMLKTLSVVVYVFLVLALAISAPMLLGFKPVIVLSGSMLPDYPIGSVTYYKQAAFEEIVVGDTITFQLGAESLATHRVVEVDVETEAFVTKGDNNDTQDPNPVSYGAVKGKTSDIAIPYAGYFIDYVKQWYVILSCGAILVLDILFTKDKGEKKGDYKQ